MILCYNCDAVITESNKSLEHIIPNAIGGRLKSSKLICRNCNTLFGEIIDADLARNFENLTALLSLKRDRPKEYIIKNLKSETGESYHLVDGRTPVPTKPVIDIRPDGIHITANNEKQLRQIINGLKRTYPNLDDENLEENFIHTKEFLNNALTISLSVGGKTFLKAVAKTALNMYLYFGGERKYVTGIIELLNDRIDNDQYIHFYPVEESISWGFKEVSHLVYLKGCSETKNLFAYVIFFSSYAFIVNFNDKYEGPSFEKTYCYDVLSLKERQRDVSINYGGRAAFKKDVEVKQQKMSSLIINSVLINLNRVTTIIDHIQIDKIIKDIKVSCMQEIRSKYPSKLQWTKSMLAEYSDLFLERAAPFIDHIQLKRK